MTDIDEYRAAVRRARSVRYRKAYLYRRHHGLPTSLVDSRPAQQHVRALLALGWSGDSLALVAKEQVSSTTLRALADGEHPLIERATEAAALALPMTVAPPEWLPGNCLVPTLGARRRIEALLSLGWPHRALVADYRIESTHLTRGTYAQTRVDKWRRVNDVYDELSMRLGPSSITVHRARAAGYQPPLAWDDDTIDDPKASPSQPRTRQIRRQVDHAVVERVLAGEYQLPTTKAEKREVARRWYRNGGSLEELMRRTGWKADRYFKASETAA